MSRPSTHCPDCDTGPGDPRVDLSVPLCTFQEWTSRVFAGGTASTRAGALAAFVVGVEAQFGRPFVTVARGAEQVAANLDGWPDDEAFGAWFDTAMAAAGCEVLD